ncbi:MAG: hypothetical protein ACN4GT_08450, partial [Gammaproteobacteria bacterium]
MNVTLGNVFKAKKTAPERGGGWALESFFIFLMCLIFVVVVSGCGVVLCCVAYEGCVVIDINAVSVPASRCAAPRLTECSRPPKNCDVVDVNARDATRLPCDESRRKRARTAH